MKFILLLMLNFCLFLEEIFDFAKFHFAANKASRNWYCCVVKFECFQVHFALVY